MWPSNEDAISRWAREVSRALDNKDGAALAYHLRGRNDLLNPSKFTGVPEESLERLCSMHFGRFDAIYKGGISQLLTEYLKIYASLSSPCVQWELVLKRCYKLLDLWMDIYLDSDLVNHHILVPSLHSLCNFINKIGTIADRAHAAAGVVHDADEEQDRDYFMKKVLSNVRSKMGRVRGDDTRHSAYIVLLGQSIKGCMQLGNMQMAAGFLKAIESTSINYSRALRGPLLNYRFYLGRLHMQKQQFHIAEEHLSWAFSNTLKDSIKMRTNILECLIVVRLALGKMPPTSVLEKYRLLHYAEIVSAIRVGDVGKFDEVVSKYTDVLTRQGTILCVENLKYLVWRTLIKKVKNWWLENCPGDRKNMLSIETLVHVIKWQQKDISNTEMLCICANLIRLEYLKGYISWERLMIVFSTVNPFPKIGGTCA